MAQPKPVPRVKLIIGVMYKESENCNTAIALLKERFGEIDDEVEYDFNFTEYYTPEMGSQLKKKLLMFKTEIDREWLAQIKLDTNAIEDEGKSEKNNRRINLDPGYLTLHNVVLASAKEMPHKVFIGKGMFGDVVLEYKNKSYQASPHTFPDFKSDKVIDFLNKVRKKFQEEQKSV